MSETIWRPGADRIERAHITRYANWLRETRGLDVDDYTTLWRWSVDDIEAFWRSIWEFFDIQSAAPPTAVLADDSMPGAKWFPGATVNYAAQVFRNSTPERPAIVFQDETSELSEIGWAELEHDVANIAAHLRGAGVEAGDRVVAYLPNRPEAIKAFLACASIGATWSICAPDLGVQGVLDRFQQIRPKVLIASTGYRYGNKFYDRSDAVAELVRGLPTLESVVVVPAGDAVADVEIPATDWADVISGDASFEPLPVPFDHPLWILYSSGTTGTPKAIVHSQGGVIVEHLKALHFHLDLGSDDRFFWYSSTAWMMWNYHIGGLLLGTTICTYDGNPGWPDMNRLWQFVSESGVTYFGAGAAFYDSCRNADVEPGQGLDLGKLRGVGATGSPLLPESYRWIYEHVGADLYLSPISGGTDFVSIFTGGAPTLPVRVGEMSCLALGAAVAAFNDAGEPVIDEVGELVCTKPMPSMPLYFWGDDDDVRYKESYFDTWPGTWRHGDWIKVTPEGGAIIYGRSDATINRHGIRMGTSELYAAVEALPDVTDSLVVDLEFLGRESYMPLFVVLKEGVDLSEELIGRIRQAIREDLSPRHVPNDVFEVEDVPRTFSGKKLEIPIRKLLLGQPAEKVINPDTMANPASVEYFVEFAGQMKAQADQGPRNA